MNAIRTRLIILFVSLLVSPLFSTLVFAGEGVKRIAP
jgi:hypothetical protein